MRLLLYGFGPYKQFRHNITQKILQSLPATKGVKKIVFPVRFHKKQFTDGVKRHRPDVILGLGQCPAGRLLRIERRAANRKRKNRSEKPRCIIPGGPARVSTTLKWKEDSEGRISYDAGDYVCNYSMYVILDYLKRRRLLTRFGFIHVPHRFDPAKAGRYLLRTLGEIE